MSQMFTPLGFAAFLMELGHGLSHARHDALEKAAVIVEAEAKRVLGTYDYHWPPLAESTKEQREKLGFPADEPGLRTGEMRDSIGHAVVSSHEAQVGSNNQKMEWFELGTETQPARPTLQGAAARKGPDVARAVGRHMHAYLTGHATGSFMREIRVREHD